MPRPSSEREPTAASRTRTSSVNQLLSTALRIRKTSPSRVARPPIQASTRPPNTRSNSILEIESGPGGGACPPGRSPSVPLCLLVSFIASPLVVDRWLITLTSLSTIGQQGDLECLG